MEDMDRFYDKEDGGQTIESLTAEHVVKDKMHLSHVLKEHTIISSATIQRDEDVGVWQIVHQNVDDGTLEEMVFTIMRALYVMDLPPVTKETSQSIQLVMGEREFKEGEMEEWKPTTAKEFITMDLSNRYFRPRNSTNEEEGIPISQDVDPSRYIGEDGTAQMDPH
ncbi:hypothetical protein ARMGADRAFT_1023033 [Armillaria gallica]|uniref:Uncharacterized protein n=1 Tax=Armillaria gallica TaxID=47427 RepID=A0A2H3ES18_ARMGA|nr:hypothetical protein ARMGADRAFT_1023033 [Armillaria gallica]